MNDYWNNLAEATKGALLVLNSIVWFTAGWRIREAVEGEEWKRPI